jgi:hypothetical protein
VRLQSPSNECRQENGTFVGAETDFDTIALSARGWLAAHAPYRSNPASHPLGVVPVPTRLPATRQGRRQRGTDVSSGVSGRGGCLCSKSSVNQADRDPSAALRRSRYPADLASSNKDIVNDRNRYINSWYGPRASRVWRAFIEAQFTSLHAIAKELGPRFIHLGYPLPHTRDVGFMEAHWCSNDPWHGNKHYGARS